MKNNYKAIRAAIIGGTTLLAGGLAFNAYQPNLQKYYGGGGFHDFSYEIPNDDFEVGNIREFDVGCHIIYVPIDENNQFNYYDGYEIVGINTNASNNEGVVFYQNTVPVQCVKDENGYTTFGVPYEKEISLY